MKTIVFACVGIAFLLGIGSELGCTAGVVSKSDYVHDASRNRDIPIEIYYRDGEQPTQQEPVLLSAGYGCSSTEYSYIAKALSDKGYLVVAIQHELETDADIPSGEHIYDLRLPYWKEGIQSLHTVLAFLRERYPMLNYTALHLIGHSNGGDISMLFTTLYPDMVRTCITLDHRRVPIPRRVLPRVLSIRGNNAPADEGVLPNDEQRKRYGIEIVQVDNAGHNYLRDNATRETKELVVRAIAAFMR